MAEEEQDVDALKRRGRRRLVGAVALVLAAVIILPMVFDPDPRTSAPPVSVRIPGEDDAPFKPRPPTPRPKEAAKAEAPAPEPVKPEPKAEPVKPEPKPEPAKPQAAPKPETPKIPSSKNERARAEAALKGGAGGEQFYVPVGAYSNPESVLAQLSGAKVPYYTEELAVQKGKVTRVRAGPFASKAAAEKAAERLKGLGLKPGSVASKAG